MNTLSLTRARESRAAIERLYIEMRHVFNRGTYRNISQPGEVLPEALLTLSPEIYGSVGDPLKVELAGLVYVIDRSPKGIEDCRFVKLISEEGYSNSGFEVLIPSARRRRCYRIDDDHMYIEVTRGRSEIYDILTHLTFMHMEANKIMAHALDEEGNPTFEWAKLEEMVQAGTKLTDKKLEVAFSFLSTILGRSFAETKSAYERLADEPDKNSGLFEVVYGLGKMAMLEQQEDKNREITFSPTLRDRLGHHIYGERWAQSIKSFLKQHNLLERPLDIISANLHSVMNCLYALPALHTDYNGDPAIEEVALELQNADNKKARDRVSRFAKSHGMYSLEDPSGTNISVQIFDTAKLDGKHLPSPLQKPESDDMPVILVMDYAFGEQAYETMDELLKPYTEPATGEKVFMNVRSVSIMGKAGILDGKKGDIMVPTAHIFEGTADNYPFDNDFSLEDFTGADVQACEGPMITVLGTSLQNRDVLSYFKESSWSAIGLEMEGAHYQKAIQAGSRIRRNVSPDITLRYAYYASDNPLLTGSTLASGSLGAVGVKPTYLITMKILERILNGK